MSWWSALGSDIYGAFNEVKNAVIGTGSTIITGAEKVGGQLASDVSGFTTSIFMNWFFVLIIYPVVDTFEWVMEEIVGKVMYGVGVFLGLVFALPDGLVIWFQGHIENLGIASPIALSFAIGIILVVSLAIGLAILKGIQYIVQEA